MFQLAKPLFLTCETPLHAGSGDSLGVVDLPIQRERHTSFPKIEASSLKGALREAFEQLTREVSTDTEIIKKAKTDKSDEIIKAFGPEQGDLHAGAIGFTDARLLLFPVKSMKGVFAWITCPKVLRQFQSDMSLLKPTPLSITLSGDVVDGSYAFAGLQSTIDIDSKVVLEEYTFTKTNSLDIKVDNDSFSNWLANQLFVENTYWHTKAKKDIIVLSDNDFKDFVNLSTEVITRIKINNDTGTVDRGALFTEEYLPSESVLYSLVLASPEFSSEAEKLDANGIMSIFEKGVETLPVIQLGGNATLGKGLLRTKLIGEPSKIKTI
jgi:CRISPR-associated protein Cmr4